MVLVFKNLPANIEDVRDVGSLPGSGRSLAEGMATHSSILAWRTPWREEPGELQSTGSHKATVHRVTQTSGDEEYRLSLHKGDSRG